MRRYKMPIISIPKSLREKLGDDGSDALVQVLNEQERETRDSVIDIAEMRFEKRLGEVESRFGVRLGEVEGSLREEIQKSKVDTIKWMFIFWIGQFGAVLGILFAVFK